MKMMPERHSVQKLGWNMLRCSPEAFAKCPTSHLCGSLAEATFADDSECAAFNKKIEESNPSGVPPYPYYEAYTNHQLIRNSLIKLLNGCMPCNGPEWPYGCISRYQGNCSEWNKLSACIAPNLADYLLSYGVTIRKDVTDTNVGSKWIPVTERLPNKEEYTTKTEYGTAYYARLLIAYKTDITEYEIGYYDGYKWMTEMPIRLIKDVVAWMPFPNIPEPPKGE